VEPAPLIVAEPLEPVGVGAAALLEPLGDGTEELELLLEPQAASASDASAVSAPIVMRRCLKFISLLAVEESLESEEGPDVKRR
jgi:hypothetical protein